MCIRDRDLIHGCVTFVEGRWTMFLPPKWVEDIVWHEAHHLARLVNADMGVVTTADEHEIDVLTQESIVRQVRRVYGIDPAEGMKPRNAS